jgi:beta-glucanase (GH16 family)|tara:strand:- start:11682 stop:13268 length:1587 start_codon:yes stop_codon:yes gene_type:complete
MIGNFKKGLLFILLIVSMESFGQQLPMDFSSSSSAFSSFSGAYFSFSSDPDSSSNAVGQFNNSGGAAWEGFAINLVSPVDLNFQNTISLDFYRFDINAHTVIVKLENGVNPDVQVLQNIQSGAAGWTNNLVFDFSNATYSSTGLPVSATGTYNTLSIFIDGGVVASGIYLIDDIDDGSPLTNPNVLDVIYTNLVWEDNFDTPGPVNSLNWHHQTQVIIPGVGWANGEEQHYTNRIDNSFVDNAGFLNIVAKQEQYSYQNLTKNYTSARLNSKFAFTYGRIDVRAKIPIVAGSWPAIWTLGKNIDEIGAYWQPSYGSTGWPACGEIDIMEHGIFPNANINYINSAIHTPCCNGGNPNQGGIITTDLANDFHVYSMNWSPNQITFLIDGVGFYTYNPAVKDASTWPFIEDQFILLNVAMGGLAGSVAPGFSQATMLVDYVKVYQSDDVSLDEIIDLKNSVNVFPNPVRNEINITSEIEPSGLALYDVCGKLILKKDGKTERLDLVNLKTGVYFLEVYFGTEKVTKKVVVE